MTLNGAETFAAVSFRDNVRISGGKEFQLQCEFLYVEYNHRALYNFDNCFLREEPENEDDGKGVV